MEQWSIELASWSRDIVGDAQLMFMAHRSITVTVICALVDKNVIRLSSRVAKKDATWCVSTYTNLRNHGEMRKHYGPTLRHRLAALYREVQSIQRPHLDLLDGVYGLVCLSEGLRAP